MKSSIYGSLALVQEEEEEEKLGEVIAGSSRPFVFSANTYSAPSNTTPSNTAHSAPSNTPSNTVHSAPSNTIVSTSCVTDNSPVSHTIFEKEEKMSVIQLKRVVVDMCSRIYRTLGPGFRELCYEKALEVELNRAQIQYLCQAPVPFYYLGEVVGMGYADIIVDKQLVLELKASKTPIAPGHLNQCRGYMRAMKIEHGLVINFPQYKARTGDLDVYDCYLGTNYPINSMSEIEKSKANENGPFLQGQAMDIEAYEKTQMVQEEEDAMGTPLLANPTLVSNTDSVPVKKRRLSTTRSLTEQKVKDLDSWFEYSNGNDYIFRGVKKAQ